MVNCNADQEINPKTGRCIKKCAPGTKRNLATGRCVKDAPTPISYMKRPCPEGQERLINGNCVKKCAPGQIRNPDTGRCVKDFSHLAPPLDNAQKCPEGQELNPKTKRCIKKCAPGTRRNPATGRCIKDIPPAAVASPIVASVATSAKKCPEGQELNPKTKRCIKKCASGTRRNPATGRCIKDAAIALAKSQQATQPAPMPNAATIVTPSIPSQNNSLITSADVKQRALFLNTICSDSGVCLAFGKEDAKIKKFFDGFSTFKYTQPTVNRVGAISANGFVNMLEYDRAKYKSYAILKSSAKTSGDNLYYEFLVGRYFINKQKRRFPCFVETYGIFKYKDENMWKLMQEQKKNIPDLNDYMTPLSEKDPDNMASSCRASKHISLLIENIKGAQTLSDMSKHATFIENDLMNILFQVYGPLSHLAKEFTHYDLHASNVLVYSPFEGNKYIDFHYHLENGKTVTFKSKYIAKIIDYGRSFFTNDKEKGVKPDDFRYNSKNVIKKICTIDECNDKQKCGSKSGYNWLNYGSQSANHYISAKNNNISHDLRLLKIVQKYITELKNNTNKIKIPIPFLLGYFDNIVYSGHYGTREILTKGYKLYDDKHRKINNVLDAFTAIKEGMDNPVEMNRNSNFYKNYTKAGDLHVYFDGRDMKFESAI